ncbi:class I SAM-dependent methyltransferase [Amphritea sp. 2_MG-2023]|uniref:class I SAM-dependent methyltransferase n=1 Tax=Amphritea TaxID=515417 RepID=UPI001C072AD2|nr:MULTISPECIES: class I SAM-dependent methyltransferase [Amphritea]MBU2964134.1 class I SAM-dependent methyltransferase [Amphritea atlantica]MDO6418533.1 class I SAM-dependent methyltransferase [Amphritea sp. 2_MG-2023]
MWDQRYSGENFVYGTEPNEFLVEQAYRIPQGSVLCLAEGEGRNAVYLAQKGYEVHAIDLSTIGRDKAMSLAEKTGTRIRYDVGDLTHLEIAPEHWSGIVSIFAHSPSALRRELHKKVVSGLQPGGVFILEAFSPNQLNSSGLGGPKDLDMLMSLLDLKQELAELDLLLARECLRPVNEGELHRGECSVIQLVGVKQG